MIESLRRLDIPNDQLIRRLQSQHKLEFKGISCRQAPFARKITLELVKNPLAIKAAEEYIRQLLTHKSEYGYLYHLMNQNLYMKLDVRFNGEMAIECARFEQVVVALNEMAKKWGCEYSVLYEITKVELLYFFLLLINPQLNWITVDFILQGTNRKGHGHLIAAPHRLLKNRKR